MGATPCLRSKDRRGCERPARREFGPHRGERRPRARQSARIRRSETQNPRAGGAANGSQSSSRDSKQVKELREREPHGWIASQKNAIGSNLVRLGIDCNRRQRIVV